MEYRYVNSSKNDAIAAGFSSTFPSHFLPIVQLHKGYILALHMARHHFLSQTLEVSPGMQSGDDLGAQDL